MSPALLRIGLTRWLSLVFGVSLLVAACSPTPSTTTRSADPPNPPSTTAAPDATPPPDAVTTESPQISVPFAIDQSLCLGREGTVVAVDGSQKSPYRRERVREGTVFDGSTASWDGLTAEGEPITWVVTLDGERDACWFGGEWTGAWDDTDPAVSWEDPYHRSGFLTLRLPGFFVEGVHVVNQGDGIRMEEGASDFHIRAAYLSDIHDDCIENDFMHSGILESSLLDGCYVALSASRFDGNDADGSSNTWSIEQNLIRMQAQPTPYSGPSPGHGQIFKWSEGGPGVEFSHNIIRVDQTPNHGTLGIPDEMNLVECEGNVVVWLGQGPYPDPLPDCFTVTTDVSVWDEAVVRWVDARRAMAVP